MTIADGGVALNKFNTPRKRNVLYLALEDNARRFQKRLKLILKGKPAPDNALFFDYWKLDTEGRNHLQTMIIKQDIGFVVVDTLSKIRPRRNRQNGFIDDYSDVAILQDIARETGASILTIHHTRKGGNEGEDVFDEISGTRGLTAACDAMWVLKPRARGSLKYTLETTGRDVEDISLAIEFEDYVWSCLGEKTEVFRSENDHKILQVVSNTPIGPKEIADLTGIKVNTVKAAVCRLLQDGLISRSVKAGKYIECKNTQPDNFM